MESLHFSAQNDFLRLGLGSLQSGMETHQNYSGMVFSGDVPRMDFAEWELFHSRVDLSTPERNGNAPE